MPILDFIAVFMPYSLFYCAIDSACLTWVVRRFNAPMRYRDILPIRASMYVLALINTSLAQGGVAYYLHRKSGISFLSALSSVLFIAMLEIYQLFLFSTVGVIFYTPAGAAQIRIVAILRIVYIAAWTLLAAVMIFSRLRGAMRGFATGSRPAEPARCSRRSCRRGRRLPGGVSIKAPTFLGRSSRSTSR